MYLGRPHPNVAFRALLEFWHRAGFKRSACRAALESQIQANEDLSAFLQPAEIAHGGVSATARLLFEFWEEERPWQCRIFGKERSLSLSFDPDEVATMAAVIRAVVDADSPKQLHSAVKGLVDGDGLSGFAELLASSAIDFGRWPAVRVPGLYRREHASILIRSETTTLIVDPTGLAPGWTSYSGRYPAESGLGHVDAILLTHSHGDHWSLPSVIALADDATTVIVPPAPRTSLLCPEDLLRTARLAGLTTQAPPWYSTVVIGDIEIDVLPFYGEQPAVDERRLDADLRNWGSCFRVNTPQFSAILLADAGSDPEGSMIEVLRRSHAERGPLDALLSVPSEFPAGINMGLAHYAFTLPFADLERISGQKRPLSMTLGPSGIVEACRISHARYYMPYADGFAGLGRPSRSGETRTAASAAEERMLASTLLPAEYVPWLPGDVAEFRDGLMTIRSILS